MDNKQCVMLPKESVVKLVELINEFDIEAAKPFDEIKCDIFTDNPYAIMATLRDAFKNPVSSWRTDFENLPTFDGEQSDNKKYLCTVSNNRVVILWWTKAMVKGKKVYRWQTYDRISPWEPIAYMEMPEPYVEGELEVQDVK